MKLNKVSTKLTQLLALARPEFTNKQMKKIHGKLDKLLAQSRLAQGRGKNRTAVDLEVDRESRAISRPADRRPKLSESLRRVGQATTEGYNLYR
jgi:hypothetical protein